MLFACGYGVSETSCISQNVFKEEIFQWYGKLPNLEPLPQNSHIDDKHGSSQVTNATLESWNVWSTNDREHNKKHYLKTWFNKCIIWK